MGETKRKRDKRPPIKPTDKLPPIPVAHDKSLNDSQRIYCRSIIDDMLADESSLSFSKPVDELWDPNVLTDYFDKIKRPMDLGTVKKRTVSFYDLPDSHLFDPNAFREEARLVFLNAISYNGKASDLGRLGTKFIHFIDSKLDQLPNPPQSEQTHNNPHTDRDKDVTMKHSHDPLHSHDHVNDNTHAHTSINNITDTVTARTNNNQNTAENGPTSADLHPPQPGSGSKKKKKNLSSSKRSSETDTKDDDDDEDDDEEHHVADTNGEDDDGADGGIGDDDDGDRDVKPDIDMGDKDDSGGVKKDSGEERVRLEAQIASLQKSISRSNANLAEIELEKNVPLSYEENSKLRDKVEGLSWDMSQKVVDILRKHVDEALNSSEEEDPEFVTLEFSTVEPKLLREIEALIQPDKRLEKEKKVLEYAERDLEAAKRKLKRLNEGDGSLLMTSSAKKKRTKKSR